MHRRSDTHLRALCVALSIICAYTFIVGFTGLLGIPTWRSPSEPIDLYFYAREFQALLSGEKINGLFLPFSYLTIALLVWPPREFLTLYAATINLMAFSVIGYWCWIRTVNFSKVERGCLFLACFACSTYGFMLQQGQFSAFFIALLAAVLLVDQGIQNVWLRVLATSFFMSLAVAKPQISLFFVLPLLVKKRYSEIALVALVVTMSSFFFASFAGVTPFEFLNNNKDHWPSIAQTGTNTIRLVSLLGVKPKTAFYGVALFFGALGTILIWRCRAASLPRLFALAGIISRLWSYHHAYDDCLIVFAVLEFGLIAIESRRQTDWIWFLALGFTLWFPTDILFHISAEKTQEAFIGFNVLQTMVWIAAAYKLAQVPTYFRPKSDIQM